MSDDESDFDETPMSEDDDPNDSDYGQEKLTLKAKKIKRGRNGKWKLYYENKVFKKEWIDLFPWVEEDPYDPKFAICRACNRKIKAHKSILETHQKTKTHLKNLSGSDDIEDDDEPKKTERPANSKPYTATPTAAAAARPSVDQMFGDDQFSFFSESPIDAAHHAITDLIDKLVEIYHENRVDNLRVENETLKHLQQTRSHIIQVENRNKLELRLAQQDHKREAEAFQLKYMQQEHELKINCMERERDAKLKAVEQQLMFARQEYERKVKLLDQQLQSMK